MSVFPVHLPGDRHPPPLPHHVAGGCICDGWEPAAPPRVFGNLVAHPPPLHHRGGRCCADGKLPPASTHVPWDWLVASRLPPVLAPSPAAAVNPHHISSRLRPECSRWLVTRPPPPPRALLQSSAGRRPRPPSYLGAAGAGVVTMTGFPKTLPTWWVTERSGDELVQKKHEKRYPRSGRDTVIERVAPGRRGRQSSDGHARGSGTCKKLCNHTTPDCL